MHVVYCNYLLLVIFMVIGHQDSGLYFMFGHFLCCVVVVEIKTCCVCNTCTVLCIAIM